MNSGELLVYTKKYYVVFKEDKPYKIIQLLNWAIKRVNTSETSFDTRITGVDSEGNTYDFTNWNGAWGESAP